MRNDTVDKITQRDTLDGHVNSLEDNIKSFHEMLEIRRSERGDSIPAEHTQTQTQHNIYAKYQDVLNVVRMQLNTYELESNSTDYVEKFATVNSLTKKIQNWMRQSDTDIDYEQCRKLLKKTQENSKTFQYWIIHAYPEFDMRRQNMWVSNENAYFETISRSLSTLSHNDIKNLVYYSISREFRWFLLLQNIFVDCTVRTEDLILRRENDNTRFLLKAVENIVNRYITNPTRKNELAYDNLHEFRGNYLWILTDTTLSDVSEMTRVESGRFVQQCGFLKAYADRYDTTKEEVQRVQDDCIDRLNKEYARRNGQGHGGYDVDYTHHHSQHQGHDRHSVHDTHDDFELTNDHSGIDESNEEAYRQEQEVLQKIAEEKKSIEEDRILAQQIQDEEDESRAGGAHLSPDNSTPKTKQDVYNQIANTRKLETEESNRVFRKYLDDYVYPPFRYAVIEVYTSGTKENKLWVNDPDKYNYKFMTKSLINQLYSDQLELKKQARKDLQEIPDTLLFIFVQMYT